LEEEFHSDCTLTAGGISRTTSTLKTPEAQLWQTFVKQTRISLDIQKNKHDVQRDFFRLVLPEMAENPTMFSVLRSIWNDLAVKMDMPEEIK
jgi:hypothetical protein